MKNLYDARVRVAKAEARVEEAKNRHFEAARAMVFVTDGRVGEAQREYAKAERAIVTAIRALDKAEREAQALQRA